MLLASYKSTRPGIQGIANRIIRRRLRGQYSHSEIVFEPTDMVDALMPDGSAAPIDGALWCVSSVAAEKLPPWSQTRAGRFGGVRFKRIALSPDRWDFVRLRGDARLAAVRARINHWLEREHIRPHIAGEFEDSALLSTFAASGMGVMPAPASLGAHLAQTCALEWVGTTPDVHEQFHLIYSARKVMHPLLTRLLEAGAGETLLDQ